MNKYAKVLVFAALVALIVVPAQAGPFEVSTPVCELIGKMQRVFQLLRVLAFIGAAFYIADWAWGFISAGKVDMAKAKEKGIGLLVGFALLFVIGLLISAVLNVTEAGTDTQCTKLTQGW